MHGSINALKWLLLLQVSDRLDQLFFSVLFLFLVPDFAFLLIMSHTVCVARQEASESLFGLLTLPELFEEADPLDLGDGLSVEGLILVLLAVNFFLANSTLRCGGIVR